MKLLCLLKGHDFEPKTHIEQGMANDWGLFMCNRCHVKIGQNPTKYSP